MALTRGDTADGFFECVDNPEIPGENVLYMGTSKSLTGTKVGFDRYKIHIAIHAEAKEFETTLVEMQNLLDRAAINKVITGYKVMKLEVHKVTSNSNRLKNLPYTVYLHNKPEDNNIPELVKLCREIEKLLSGVRPGNKSTGSIADIELSEHLVFRQSAFQSPEYIESNDTRAGLLAEAARHSDIYQAIRKALMPGDKKDEKQTTSSECTILWDTDFFSIPKDGMRSLISSLFVYPWGASLFARDKKGAKKALRRCLADDDLFDCSYQLMAQYSNSFKSREACFELLFDSEGDKLWRDYLRQEAKSGQVAVASAYMYWLLQAQLQQLPPDLNINVQFEDGATPLIRALQAGQKTVASGLIKRGADVSTVLNWALANDDRAVVENALAIKEIHTLALQNFGEDANSAAALLAKSKKVDRSVTEDELFETVFNPTIHRPSVPYRGKYKPLVGKSVAFDRYKIHIAMYAEAKAFAATFARLGELLDVAVKNKVITGYKVLKPEVHRQQTTPGYERVRNFPYTLYLPNNPWQRNLPEMVKLCQQIEKILKGVQPGDKSAATPGDVALSDHLAFCQTAFDGLEYIEATDTRTGLLAVAARHSDVYQALRTGLTPFRTAKNKGPEIAEATVLQETNFFDPDLSVEGIKNVLDVLLNQEWGTALFTGDEDGTRDVVTRCLMDKTTELFPYVLPLMKKFPDSWKGEIAVDVADNRTKGISLLCYLIKGKLNQAAVLLVDHDYVAPKACFDFLFDSEGDKLWRKFLRAEAKSDPKNLRAVKMYQLLQTQLHKLPKDLNINVQFEDKSTPLIRALQAGQMQVAQVLIDRGADFSTVLNWALANEDFVVIENALAIKKIHESALQSSGMFKEKLNELAHAGETDLLMAFLLHGFPFEPSNALPPHQDLKNILRNYAEMLDAAKERESVLMKTAQEFKESPQKTLASLFKFIQQQRKETQFTGGLSLVDIDKAVNDPQALKEFINKQIKAQLKNANADKFYGANLFILQKWCRDPALMQLTPQVVASSSPQQPKA